MNDRRSWTFLKLFFLIMSFGYNFCHDGLMAKGFQTSDILDSQQLALKLKLADKTQWQRLLHYRRTFWGGWESEADNENFFLAGWIGKTNPEKELLATIESFFKPLSENADLTAEQDLHARCRFPARFTWINRELKIDQSFWPKITCPKLSGFLDLHQVQSASLVFSSYYLNSPASAFGHTLLRLNKGPHYKTGKIHELLDFGINYAANVSTQNPFLYTILGMTGGFDGAFSSVPYFYKIREYNDFESRDLWAYDLNLNDDELKMLIHHLWELGSTTFDYYYLTENCSYHLLAAIEVVNPEWQLLESLPFYVIPADTIKALYRVPGLVKSIQYRPSLRTKYNHGLEQLSPEEKIAFKEMIKSSGQVSLPGDLTNLAKNSRYETQSLAKVLDTSIDYIDYKFAEEILLNTGDKSRWKEQLLASRADLGLTASAKALEIPLKNRPHLGHGSSRLGTAWGYSNNFGAIQNFQWRGALHDLLDSPIGQPEFSHIEFGKVDFRYEFENQRLSFQDLALVEVTSISPIDETEKGVSVRAKIGGEMIDQQNIGCENKSSCFVPNLELGFGIGHKTYGDIPVMFSLMLETDLAIRESLSRTWTRWGLGPQGKMLIYWSDQAIMQIHALAYQFPTHKNSLYSEFGLENRFQFSSDWAINFKSTTSSVDQGNFEREWISGLGFFYYY